MWGYRARSTEKKQVSLVPWPRGNHFQILTKVLSGPGQALHQVYSFSTWLTYSAYGARLGCLLYSQHSVLHEGVPRKRLIIWKPWPWERIPLCHLIKPDRDVNVPEHSHCGNESHHRDWLLWHHVETVTKLKGFSQVKENLADGQEKVRGCQGHNKRKASQSVFLL